MLVLSGCGSMLMEGHSGFGLGLERVQHMFTARHHQMNRLQWGFFKAS